MNEKERNQLMVWHRLVVEGLVNGLSHTATDGRTEELNFWRKRSQLFNAFSLCIQSFMTEQSWEYSEKDLREIAKEGYKPSHKTGRKE